MKIRKYVWLFLYLVPCFVAVSYVVAMRRMDLGAFFAWYNENFIIALPEILAPLFNGIMGVFGVESGDFYTFVSSLVTYYLIVMFVQLCLEFILLVPTLIKKWLDRRLER